MGFFDKLKDFIVENKIVVGTIGAAGLAAISYLVYLVATDEELLNEQAPALLKETSAQERQLQSLKATFNRKDPQQIKKLAGLLQTSIEQATKKNQEQFRQMRLAAKKKGFREHFDAITDGMGDLTTQISKIQNAIFDEFNITEDQFEQICSQNPAMLAQMYQNQASSSASKTYSLQEMKAIIQQQRNFLTNPNLINDLKGIMQGLPQEALMQLPVYIAILMTDAIGQTRQFDENSFNKSLSVHIMSIQRDLQQQQMLMQGIMAQIMGGAGGFPGMGGMMGGMGGQQMGDEYGQKAQLAAMLGLDPEALDEQLMKGDNEMLMKMMQTMGPR